MSQQCSRTFSRATAAFGRSGAANFSSSYAGPATRAPTTMTTTRSFFSSGRAGLPQQLRKERFNPLDQMAVKRRNEAEISQLKKRMRFAGMGLAFSFLGIVITTQLFPVQPPAAAIQNDAPPNSPDFGPNGTSTTLAPPGVDLVETGTSTIPHFPRTITLPAHESTRTAALPSGTGDADAEFSLLGLGVRSVSFLSIQVYVVGIYVANSDLAALQAAFVKEGANAEAATALIAGEKDSLRRRLLDGEESERIWERVLERQPLLRSVIRIVPTRSTDFAHLRDGFERNINAKVRARPEMAEDDSLGKAVGDFKAMLGRAKLAKGEEVLLERGRQGELRAWYKKGESGKDTDWTALGKVDDERISRLMLLGYLGGKKPASEPCRQSVVNGVIHAVERPIGTAETEIV